MRAPEFWYGPPGTASTLLAPLGALYDIAGRIKRGLARPERVTVPVVCVGNLVAGGAGKTPVSIDIVRRLQEAGRRPHVVSRGYGGREAGPLRVDPARHDAAAVGDEPLLLARSAPTWVARDRVAGGRAAVGEGADCLLLDDGFQNPALWKDLSLVVIDGASGFGNGRVMPAGPLRETVDRGLSRAQAAVVLGDAQPGLIESLPGDLQVLRARVLPEAGAEALRGRRVLAFAGIARPGKFFATLRALGAEIVETRSFPDHHPYSTAEVDGLLSAAATLEAEPVTTEKDLVRIPEALRRSVRPLGITLAWEDPTALDALLSRL